MKTPKLSHPNCTNKDCSVCFEEHIALNAYLFNMNRFAGLEDYRRYLDNVKGESSETETGWAKPYAFDPDNINAFLKSMED
jgi:hypothetical protein